VNVPDGVTTPLDFFRLFWTTSILKGLKRETNNYAAQAIATKQNAMPHSIYKLWKPVTLNEIRALFVVFVHMCLVCKSNIAEYWSTLEIVHTPFASTIISRDRFMQILSFFHINNNTTYIPFGQPGHKPLAKLQPICDHLRDKFKELYTPQQNIAIDEAICPFKGRLRFKVYMKDKPHKWGIKFYEVCESSSGYVWDFEVYCGDTTLSNRPVDVCMRLMEPLLGKGYVLYTDNYYTCPELAEKLLAKQTMCVGTVRSNRVGMPKDLVSTVLKRGERDYRRRNQLVALKWMDKKPVHLLTTIHNPTTTVNIRTPPEVKEKPVAIQDYVLNMRGVDKSDQFLSYSPLRKKTVKWWKKVFSHLLSLTIIQSTILHNKCSQRNNVPRKTIHDFILQLGTEMAEEFRRKRAERLHQHQLSAANRALTAQPARFVERHFPSYIPSTPKKQRPARECVVCHAAKRQRTDGLPQANKRKETVYWCEPCGKPLCVVPCFQKWHTMDYTG